MNLFDNEPLTNLIPLDGIAIYYGKIFDVEKSNFYFNSLFKQIEWKNDEAIIFGKHIITARKVAWYGDKPYEYHYSNGTKIAQQWSEELLFLKKTVEYFSGETFNSCLLNLYHNGNEGVGWHSDDEKTLKKNGAIASLSFGASRNFNFKHKKNPHKASIYLENGSLLIMKGELQQNWLHCLPKSTKIKHPRISLTFRTIV